MSMHVVSSILNQLSTLILHEARLLGGLGLEIRNIVDELGHMKAFLRFAEAREEEEDPRLEEWIVQVQDIVYDIQDVVDEFMLRFRHHQHRQGFYGHARKIFTSMKDLQARHQIASKIQSIKSRITSIAESHKRYQFEYDISNQQVLASANSMALSNSLHDYRDEALLVEEAKLVGINHPKQKLISQLLDGDSELKVVSILGMGGMGKTTLVKKVQEDANVKRRFQALAWVTVSQICDMKELLKDLIQQLYQEIRKPVPQQVEASITSTDRLKVLVKDFLQDKRYLIVFDDVWDPKFGHVIKFALPEGSCGNRVMLTARIADAANASNVEFHSYVHQMEPLSSDDSWTLFCKKTFKDNCCPSHLEAIAKGILRKCEGLPLAIVTISRVLALKNQNKLDEWKMIERSLGGELEGSGKLDTVRKVLSLSYNELPYHLKTCLLYVSIYPEDYKIEDIRLIRLWIAEGFVQEKRLMTKYEVARAYLDGLTNRSLIQVTCAPYDPYSRVYHIHDLLREIILSKSSKQNFATIATGERRSFPKKVRRLAIHDFKFDAKESISFKYLRSLVIFKPQKALSKSLLSELLCNGCRLLKVLDLEGTDLEEIPEEVFELFHLKALSLKHTRVNTIPTSIGSLKNLEYLDLSYTNVSELPKDILKIEGLTHLVVYQCDPTSDYFFIGFKGPNNIAKLLSLEWLFCIEANERLIREIGELKQLKKLGILSLRREDGKQLCSSLGKLSNLEQLFVQAVEDDELIDLKDMNVSLASSLQNLQVLYLRGRLESIPQLVCSLQGLTLVVLLSSRLMDDPLESLQYLPNLQQLFLDQAFQGEVLCFRPGCFLKLESLSLVRLHNLRWLRVEEGAMPNLELLGIIFLNSLEEFPWGFQHLKKLQQLYLERMSDAVISQLQNQDEESEDFRKIIHIPKIMIWDEEDGWCRHPQYWNTGKLSMTSIGWPAHLEVEGTNPPQSMEYVFVCIPSEIGYLRS